GVLGRKVEPVVEDPASNWDLFAEKSKKLLLQDKVAAVFGCWTSVSRKSVLPVFEKYNGHRYYPVQYGGEECSKNVIYNGATINQQATRGVDYLMSPEGGGKKKFYLLGSDYVYPRTTNKILRLYLTKVKKVPESAIAEEHTPFHHQDYQTIVGKIKSFSAAGDAAVINTINGDSNVPFFKELANQGVTADKTPTMSYSFAEVELQTLDVKPLVGHLASWNYFMSLKTPDNLKWVKAYKEWCKGHSIPDKQCVTDDPMMHAYIHVHLWAKAVQKAESTDVEKVLKALEGLEIPSPVGKYKVDEKNHHTWKPVYIGKIREDGQFDVVWNRRRVGSPHRRPRRARSASSRRRATRRSSVSCGRSRTGRSTCGRGGWSSSVTTPVSPTSPGAPSWTRRGSRRSSGRARRPSPSTSRTSASCNVSSSASRSWAKIRRS